jgi:hypothetical protein
MESKASKTKEKAQHFADVGFYNQNTELKGLG